MHTKILFFLITLMVYLHPAQAIEQMGRADGPSIAAARFKTLKKGDYVSCKMTSRSPYHWLRNVFSVPNASPCDAVPLQGIITNRNREDYLFDRWQGLASTMPYVFDDTGKRLPFNSGGLRDFVFLAGQSRHGNFFKLKTGQTETFYWLLTDWYDLEPNKTYRLKIPFLTIPNTPDADILNHPSSKAITFRTSDYIPPPKPMSYQQHMELLQQSFKQHYEQWKAIHPSR